ncbi:peptidase M3A and M3B thimet/oligopeptidase F [Halovivax asiaticus JCM 14624]|uniref:Peptidase M3A and M3B thimet/oligopeptidase F n=1 Tax=Halovivax asiaticus JCM 14624 TaxID=1227490 RepID=M0BPA9_9EURY|nr:M3 family metallopeptidase [Halovivax asiaticus]ELZ12312.1 peptidase M3A and M3B thimet/oligopeptidase F [Halovivax asiaticus JCM 14624]
MQRSRSDIDDRYQWDLTTIYETPADFDREYQRADTLVDAISDELDTPPEGSATLVTLLERFECLTAARTRLECYAECSRTIDLTDDAARDRQDRTRSLAGEVDGLTSDVRRYCRRHANRLADLRTESDALAPFERFLENAVDGPAADPSLRSLLETFGDVLDGHDRTLTAICDEDFEPPIVEGSDGDPVAVRWHNRVQLLKDPDRDFRRRVYEAFHDALDERANAIATAWTEKLRTRARVAEARGFDSIREMGLSKASYPKTGIHLSGPSAVHDTLLETVSENLEPYHRLQRRRRIHLAVDEFRPWDRHVSLTSRAEPTISYEDACEYVLAAVEPLGVEYRTRLEALLEERRVDVYPAADSRDVTYCLSASGVGPFVSLSYDGSVRALFHFAHELGHAMETDLRADVRRPLYETTPRPVEEVPSLVHELLLADHLLDNGDDALTAHVLNRRLDAIGGNLFGAAQSARFTHEAAMVVERGDSLTRERLDGINRELHSEFRPVEEPAEYTPSAWLARAHVREPYHNYQYVLGAAGAVSVYEALVDSRLSVEDYRTFLQFGGTKSSMEQFAHLGVDVTAPTPYERAATWVDRDVDSIEGNRSDAAP